MTARSWPATMTPAGRPTTRIGADGRMHLRVEADVNGSRRVLRAFGEPLVAVLKRRLRSGVEARVRIRYDDFVDRDGVAGRSARIVSFG